MDSGKNSGSNPGKSDITSEYAENAAFAAVEKTDGYVERTRWVEWFDEETRAIFEENAVRVVMFQHGTRLDVERCK